MQQFTLFHIVGYPQKSIDYVLILRNLQILPGFIYCISFERNRLGYISNKAGQFLLFICNLVEVNRLNKSFLGICCLSDKITLSWAMEPFCVPNWRTVNKTLDTDYHNYFYRIWRHGKSRATYHPKIWIQGILLWNYSRTQINIRHFYFMLRCYPGLTRLTGNVILILRMPWTCYCFVSTF